MREEIHAGQQCFVVCPLIEPSESLEAASALNIYEQLRTGEFADHRVDLLHGRMTLPEKQNAMEQFRSGETQVLVSTTVIEVGVDVPNATVMMVMSADRFGMSQLHQLRGRVGRGEQPGTCYLVADPESDTAKARIDALVRLSDGFRLGRQGLGDARARSQSSPRAERLDRLEIRQVHRLGTDTRGAGRGGTHTKGRPALVISKVPRPPPQHEPRDSRRTLRIRVRARERTRSLPTIFVRAD